LNDDDLDGICNEFELSGCMDVSACNFESWATDAGLCFYAEQYYDCNGNCLFDDDLDGICNELEVLGCSDSSACNFNPSATELQILDCVFPSVEICNDFDDDCDGEIDNGLILNSWFVDNDSDGYGGLDSIQSCQTVLPGWVLNHEDCDDSNALINPASQEILDNDIDENCDGNIELNVLNREPVPMVIYPNPNNGEFVVKTEEPIYFEIIDQQGKVVARDMVSKEKRVQLNTLSDGIYLFKSSKGVATFVIQK
jgi:hypothetical protein